MSGAIQFDDAYIYNPLVFCGTAGVIPTMDIHKEMPTDAVVISVGAESSAVTSAAVCVRMRLPRPFDVRRSIFSAFKNPRVIGSAN